MAEAGNVRLSDEKDENGNPFVISKNGTIDFGTVDEEQAKDISTNVSAPIRLSYGNEDYGYMHMQKHIDQLKQNGYQSVEDFVEDVVNGKTEIRQGNVYIDEVTGEAKETYLFVKKGNKGSVLYIELVPNSKYYTINSGGVFRNSYIEKKKELWSASTEHSTTSGEPQDFPPAQIKPESDDVSALSQGSFDGKGSEKSPTSQEKSKKTAEDEQPEQPKSNDTTDALTKAQKDAAEFPYTSEKGTHYTASAIRTDAEGKRYTVQFEGETDVDGNSRERRINLNETIPEGATMVIFSPNGVIPMGYASRNEATGKYTVWDNNGKLLMKEGERRQTPDKDMGDKGHNGKENTSSAFQYFTGTISELVEAAKTAGSKLVKKVIAPVSKRLIDDLRTNGVNISGDYQHTIDNSAINHSLLRHSSERERLQGQVPLVEKDFDRIEEIVSSYDEMTVSDGKGNSPRRISYIKHYPDGTTYFVEEIRKGRKELAAVTIRKYKNSKLTGETLFQKPSSNTPKATPDSTAVSTAKVENNSQTTKHPQAQRTDAPKSATKEQIAIRDGMAEHLNRTGLQTFADEQLGQRLVDKEEQRISNQKENENNIRSGIAAIRKIAAGADFVADAMHRNDLAQYGGETGVSFYWGKTGDATKDYKGGYGLSHISAKHGTETLLHILDVIANGKIGRYVKGNKTVVLTNSEYECVLALTKNGDKETWLLSGWKKNEKAGGQGEVSTQSKPTQTNPTFSRADLGAAFSDAKINDFFNNNKQPLPRLREQRAYHGSGANFDSFDSSHMGEGEGAQAHGWGHYVAVETGTARGYAESARVIPDDEAWRSVQMDYEIDNDIATREAFGITEPIFIEFGYNIGDADTFGLLKEAAKYYGADIDTLYDKENEEPTEKGEELLETLFYDMDADFSERMEKSKTNFFGPFLYTVDIPDNTGKNYIEESKTVSKTDRARITDQLYHKLISENNEGLYDDATAKDELFKELKNDFEGSTNLTGRELYEKISSRLGSDKAASEFLHSIGYNGIHYYGRQDGECYVIFDDNDLEITDKVCFFRSSAGEILGFTVGGKIYLDPRKATPETAFHEYGHIWLEALKQGNRKEYDSLMQKVKDDAKLTPIWEEVKKNYPGLSDEALTEEVFVMYSGRKGSRRIEERIRQIAAQRGMDITQKATTISALQQLKQAIQNAWRGILDFLHINYKNVDEAVEQQVKDFIMGNNPLDALARHQGRYTAEEQSIIDSAKRNGTYMKAPNGKKSKLTPYQWVQTRTKAFKQWFGDWEKGARIQKLRNSDDAVISGNEIEPSNDLKQYRKNALEYGKKLQGAYTNQDTGEAIQLQRGRKNGGVNEVLQHNYKDVEHLQSIAAIPQIIENSIYIDSEPNHDIAKNPNVTEYQHFVCGLKIGSTDYTVHSIVAVDKNGNRYYDHSLTQIEKTNLLDLIESQADDVSGFGTTPGTQPTTLSTRKGQQLISLLQTNSSKVVDENGEPLVVYHGTNNEFYTFMPKEGSRWSGGTERKTVAKGYFVTDDLYFARKYAYARQEQRGGVTIIMPLYTNMRHPADLSSKTYEAEELFSKLTGFWPSEVPGYDDISVWWKIVDSDNEDIEWNINDKLKELGYDGIIFAERAIEDEEGIQRATLKSFFLPSSTQIKSATDNEGTFDRENPDIRFQFAGEKGARNLDTAEERTERMDNLSIAREMEAAKKDAKAIKLATGWERGGDGLWRYEIPDAQYTGLTPRRRYEQLLEARKRLTPEQLKKLERYENLNTTPEQQREYEKYVEQLGLDKLGYWDDTMLQEGHGQFKLTEMLSGKGAEQLFKAYPELRNINVSFEPLDNGTYANYNDRDHTITLNSRLFADGFEHGSDLRTTLLHEIQHVIQDKEGFAPGSSVDYFERQIRREPIYRNLSDYKEELKSLRRWVTPDDTVDTLKQKLHNGKLRGKDKTVIVDAMDYISNGGTFNDLLDEYMNRVVSAELELNDVLTSSNSAYGRYTRTAGEVEARNVERRNDMTEEERRQTLAKETEDVAPEDQIFLRGEGDNAERQAATAESRTREEDVEEVNKKFNEELQEQIDGKQESGHVYQLGMPSAELQSTGIPSLPIRLQSSILNAKTNDPAHQYDLAEIKDLVRLIQRPIAIFAYGNKEKAQNLMIGISQQGNEGKQFLVGLSLRPTVKGQVLEINSVRNVFPKNYHDWIHWINQGKMLRVDGKKEIQDIIDALRINPVDYISNDDLDSAAKLVQEFENPPIEGEKNSSEGRLGSENRNTGHPSDIIARTSGQIDAEYPNWLEGTTTGSGKHTTQVAGTRKTYGHVGDWIEKHLGKDVRILDASSGMGYGTKDLRERGFNIEDVEPYQSEERKRENPATYSSYDDVNGKYDYIISNAVLNVIPDDWRRDVLHDMADRLNEGGRLFINTRKAGEEKHIKDKIELDSPREVLVKRGGRIASYQRFFTPEELRDYVADELGNGYKVEIAGEENSGTKGLAAVVVTKEEADGRDIPISRTETTDPVETFLSRKGGSRSQAPTKEQQEQMKGAAESAAKALHLGNVRIITTPKADDPNSGLKAYYDKATGQIVIYAGNHSDNADIARPKAKNISSSTFKKGSEETGNNFRTF